MSHLTIMHTFCLHFVLYDDNNVTHIIGFRLKCVPESKKIEILLVNTMAFLHYVVIAE